MLGLYGCGFNAHGQIHQHALSIDRKSASQNEENLVEFVKIASATKNLEVDYASWSRTMITCDDEVYTLGGTSSPQLLPGVNAASPREIPGSIFGERGFKGSVFNIRGQLFYYAITLTGHTAAMLVTESSPNNLAPDSTLHLVEHENIEAATKWMNHPMSVVAHPSKQHKCSYSAVNLEGGSLHPTATGWVLLTDHRGAVYTWGDQRYAYLLGRHVSPGEEAEVGIVQTLGGLEISKISTCAAGGIVAALTSVGDVYMWGRAGVSVGGSYTFANSSSKSKRIDTLAESERTGRPARVCIYDKREHVMHVMKDRDWIDVAVGKAHAILLDTDGNVYVAGDNTYGQLGLGKESVTVQEHWCKVNWIDELKQRGQRVTKVRCGDLTSFLIVDDHSQPSSALHSASPQVLNTTSQANQRE